jgi:hypothetical protein
VQDFLTDEKLIECTASANGIYIRIMCIMHKAQDYGVILLKQKDKLHDNQIKNFASKIARQLPFKEDEIIIALNELIDNEVLFIDNDKLIQRRMVRDNEISLIRSNVGRVGGLKSQFAKAKDKAKEEANTENENENVIEVKIKNKEEREIFDEFRKVYPGIKRGLDVEFDNFIRHKDWRDVLPLLSTRLQYQKDARQAKRDNNLFVPPWKNLKTWINNRCWEDIINTEE